MSRRTKARKAMRGRPQSHQPAEKPARAPLAVTGSADQIPPAWPSYQGTSRFVGVSPSGRVTVFVDPTLAPPGLQNAEDLLNDADRVVTANDNIFARAGGPVSVIVFALGGATDGTGGADHLGCDYSTGAAIEVCASFDDPARVSALFEAELSECSMNGDLCGQSTGEALSRWCAAVISDNALADFATAPLWALDGMPDFVNQTDATDQDPDSIGCGMAFISWLISQGYGLEMIAPTMAVLGDAGTLAQLYSMLTTDDPGNAWTNFQNAVQSLPNGVTSDDPFACMAQAQQILRPAPWKMGQAGGMIPAGVRAAMASEPREAPVCEPKSRRLVPPGKGVNSAAPALQLTRTSRASRTSGQGHEVRIQPTEVILNAVADLSHHNGDVDLELARGAGILGIIHKATQGPVFMDPLYEANRSKARAAGLLWGAYHFGTGGDGIVQAEHFLATAQVGAQDLLVLDLEHDLQGPSMTLEEARAFVTHLRQVTGRWPGLYAGHYLKELLGTHADPILGQCWFWLAQYGPTAVVPPAWRSWTLWQYTDGALGPEPHQVDGIGRCDRDRFNGGEAALREFWAG